MNKRELYLHEKPILIFPARIQKTGYFTIPIKVIDQLEIDENYVVLFRLKDFPEYDLLSKVTSVRKTGNKELRLNINNSVRSKLNLILPKTIELEIMYIYKKGYKPCFDKIDGLIDILSYFFDDKRFTIFDRGNGYMTVHYLERSCPSIITIPKYLKIDEFSCWNFGFYLAEGTKQPKGYRFSADNAKEYLMERFRDFGENYLGIDRDEWFLDISTDQYHENKIDFWKRKLGINEDKIKLKVIKSKPPLAKYGNASLTIYDKILGFLIKKLIFDIGLIKNLSYENAFAFLRGAEAGDGGVLDYASGKIELTMTSLLKDLDIYKYLFSFVCSKPPKIKDHYACDKVKILFYSGLDMTREYIMKGHFKEHRDRWSKLIRIYKNRDKVKIQFKYLNALKYGCVTLKQISLYAGTTRIACACMMKRFIEFGFVECTKEDKEKIFHGNANIFNLTDEGERYVSLLSL